MASSSDSSTDPDAPASPFADEPRPPSERVSRRHRRHRQRRRDDRLVAGTALVAAVVGGMAPSSPTGLGVADVAWCAALAGATTWAGSRARRWTWLWAAG